MKLKTECFGCDFRISGMDRFGGGCDLMEQSKLCIRDSNFANNNLKLCIICKNISNRHTPNPHCNLTEVWLKEYVTGRECLTFKSCSNINISGDCPDFEQIKESV
jgi:hypothetical protein